MPVIESARITHTTLESAAIASSVRFYREVMGLRVIQHLPKACLILATNGHYAAAVELPKRAPQTPLNYYARPVADAAAVDAVYARIAAVRDAYGLLELTAPAREDPARFGVGTYGFYLRDQDGNWWRVEENDSPFGPVELPADAEPRGAIVPAGPISYVTLESRNLPNTLRFFRDFLGVDVEQPAPHYFLSRGNGGVHEIVVEVGDRLSAQTVMKHHGATVWADQATIDRFHAATEAAAGTFGLGKIMPACHQHGSYSYYMQDQDSNWWEIELWEEGINPWQSAERKQAAGALPVASA